MKQFFSILSVLANFGQNSTQFKYLVKTLMGLDLNKTREALADLVVSNPNTTFVFRWYLDRRESLCLNNKIFLSKLL